MRRDSRLQVFTPKILSVFREGYDLEVFMEKEAFLAFVENSLYCRTK